LSYKKNLYRERIRLELALHKPLLTQEDLEHKLQLFGSRLKKQCYRFTLLFLIIAHYALPIKEVFNL